MAADDREVRQAGWQAALLLEDTSTLTDLPTAQWPWEKKASFLGWLTLKGNPSRKKEKKGTTGNWVNNSHRPLDVGRGAETISKNVKCFTTTTMKGPGNEKFTFWDLYSKWTKGKTKGQIKSSRFGQPTASGLRLGNKTQGIKSQSHQSKPPARGT